jgi:nicotinamidase-related amidase
LWSFSRWRASRFAVVRRRFTWLGAARDGRPPPARHHIFKKLPSAFAGTDLDEWLKRHGIDTLTVAGYMSHNCDDTTIKHAFDAGLAVEFLNDACGSVSYANSAGSASAEKIHRVFSVVHQSRFAAVLRTAAWIECVAAGTIPARDTIHASHQRALKAVSQRTAA